MARQYSDAEAAAFKAGKKPPPALSPAKAAEKAALARPATVAHVAHAAELMGKVVAAVLKRVGKLEALPAGNIKSRLVPGELKLRRLEKSGRAYAHFVQSGKRVSARRDGATLEHRGDLSEISRALIAFFGSEFGNDPVTGKSMPSDGRISALEARCAALEERLSLVEGAVLPGGPVDPDTVIS